MGPIGSAGLMFIGTNTPRQAKGSEATKPNFLIHISFAT